MEVSMTFEEFMLLFISAVNLLFFIIGIIIASTFMPGLPILAAVMVALSVANLVLSIAAWRLV
jgi:hypothetical protein